MPKILTILLFTFFLFISCEKEQVVSNTWAEKSKLSEDFRHEPVGFALLGKGYIGLGSQITKGNRDWWSYDPRENKWTKLNDFQNEQLHEGFSFRQKQKDI